MLFYLILKKQLQGEEKVKKYSRALLYEFISLSTDNEKKKRKSSFLVLLYPTLCISDDNAMADNKAMMKWDRITSSNDFTLSMVDKVNGTTFSITS